MSSPTQFREELFFVSSRKLFLSNRVASLQSNLYHRKASVFCRKNAFFGGLIHKLLHHRAGALLMCIWGSFDIHFNVC